MKQTLLQLCQFDYLCHSGLVDAKIIASDIDLPVTQNELLSLIVLHLSIFLVFQVPISEYIDLC